MLPVLAYVMSTLILTSAISYLAGRVLKNRTGFLTALGLALATLLLLSVTPKVFKGEIHEEYAWTRVLPLKLGLRADGLSLTLALIIAFVSALASVYSVEYMKNGTGHGLYFALLSLMAFTMTGAVLATDLATLFFFWEFTVIIPVFIIAKWGYGDRWATAIRFFLFSRFGGGLLLAGLAIAYASFGTLDMRTLTHSAHNHYLKPGISALIALLMTLGFSVKMAVWPFHGWIPSAYANAPAPVAAILSGVMSKLGVYGVVRVIQIFHGAVGWEVQALFMALAFTTAIYGGTMALRRDDLREILAYSSMSHMGYMFLGFSTLATHGHGFTGSLLHMVNHTLSKSILFLCAGSMLQLLGTVNVKRLRGWYRRAPTLFVLAVVGALGLIGLPPSLGFWSKDMLLGFSLELGYLAAALMAIVALLSAAYNLRWIFYAFTKALAEKAVKPPLTTTVPIVLLAALALTPLTYMDHLVHLMRLEHVAVELIPLLMTGVALALGSSTVYASVFKGWALPKSLVASLETLLKVASLEWFYVGAFVKGFLDFARWMKANIDMALDGLNYFLASSTLKVAGWMFNSVERAVDGFNYLLAGYAFRLSQRVRKLQTGILSYNVLAVLLALLVLLLLIVARFGVV